ncbi:MAG: enoyl-CoA hydratase-related protein [Pseudomonadota bacterium]
MSTLILTTIDARGIARVTLNRPDLRNAFNEEMIGQICDTIGQLSSDENVRIVIITGAGKAFSAGADLNMMQRVANYSSAENKDDARRLAHMLESIYDCPKPTIALVNGPAMGGGLGLIAACDIAICSDDAFFALSEVKVGLIPAVISPFVVEAIGIRQARRYFLTAERFSAETAREIGLIHKTCIPENLAGTLEETLETLLEGAPRAQAKAKALIRTVAYKSVGKQTREETAALIAEMRAADEGREGVTAFLEKRKPNWARGPS